MSRLSYLVFLLLYPKPSPPPLPVWLGFYQILFFQKTNLTLLIFFKLSFSCLLSTCVITISFFYLLLNYFVRFYFLQVKFISLILGG